MTKIDEKSDRGIEIVSDEDERTDAGWERRRVARLNFTKEQF